MIKRVFLVVLDSFGIGFSPDAKKYGDVGANTLKSISEESNFSCDNLKKLGLFNIDGVCVYEKCENPSAAHFRLSEKSCGKDTVTGHWEIAGLVLESAFPAYPDGFPDEIISEFSRRTKHGVLCNKPYSGTDVIKDFGEKHLKTGDLIVYTSADSVFQIAAHEDIVPCELLYEYCEIAREILCGKHSVGRVIARPFKGEKGNFYRTAGRHDYSLKPPRKTVLDYIKESGKDVIGVGKIGDIFSNCGITQSYSTKGNDEGIRKLSELLDVDFSGLCFVNLVDFDMLYGHRNDAFGYAGAISYFDKELGKILDKLNNDDILIICADHGCDPKYPGTDHTREYIPVLITGEKIKNVNLKTMHGFGIIGATVLEMLGIEGILSDKGILKEIIKEQ